MPAVRVGELADALEAGFRQDTAEKVHRLLAFLREWEETSEGRGKLTLKGGTALNIFHLPNPPRLSVDIDLMATGFPAAGPGTPQREEVVRSVADVARRLDYRAVQRGDLAGAGVGFVLRYENSVGSEDVIKIDLDLLNRLTLLPAVQLRGPELFGARDFTFPIVDRAELLGQKLIAVVYRQTARDPFDMYQMILRRWHALPRAREMYLAYSFLQDSEWPKLDYPTRLDEGIFGRIVREEALADVLRFGEVPPSLAVIREAAQRALGRHRPPFTRASDRDESLRRELLDGRRSAFAEIAGVTEPHARAELETHPGLRFRLLRARGLGTGRPTTPGDPD